MAHRTLHLSAVCLQLLLLVAVWLACLSGRCEGRKETQAGDTTTPATKQDFGRRRKPRDDCDELRDMWLDKGCIQEDSRKCRLLAFRIEGGRLGRRPRCDFMPCERYGQPANQTCERFCLGTRVPGGVCETGKTCCVQGARPTPAPPSPKTPCAFTCRSSTTCQDTTTGACPYSGQVCCVDKNPYPYPDPFPTQPQTCPHQCVSVFDCLEVDSYSSCGHGFGLNVCCKTVGSRFPYLQNNAGGADTSLPFVERSVFPGGFGSFPKLGGLSDFGLGVFGRRDKVTVNQQPPQPYLPPARKPGQGSDIQPLPCAYTCLPPSACGETDPASSPSTCGGPALVCCRVALPPPVSVGDDETTCPFECTRANRCAEADSTFTCAGRKVCCKTTKKEA